MRYFHHLAIAALLAAAPLSATSVNAQTAAPAGGAMSTAAPANHMSGNAAPTAHHPMAHHKKAHVVSKPAATKVPQPLPGGDPGTGDVKH